MKNLQKILRENDVSTELKEIIEALASASVYINAAIRMKDTEKNKDANVNTTGDTQSALDILSDNIVEQHLRNTNLVKTIASEEREDIVVNDNATKKYFVAYDPYDGGSVGDVNMTFGSIFGIWSDNPMGKKTGEDLIASCYTLYGPRVTFCVCIKDIGTFLFELNEVGDFLLTRDEFIIAPDAQYFAPGNLKACNDNEKYREVVLRWIDEGKKLRYGGALVTDINHILLKGDGIFCYPGDDEYPTGRLRLLYEGAPLGFLLEQNGGSAYNQTGQRILDETVTDYHQRTSFFLGSTKEVETVTKMMQ